MHGHGTQNEKKIEERKKEIRKKKRKKENIISC